VEFAPGVYQFDSPVQFHKQDSGTANAPIVYRADGGEVRFTGGIPTENWTPVTDEAVLGRLPVETRTHVVVADLPAQGISDFGTLGVHGFAMGSPVAEAELFYGDAPMTLARWPNKGFRGVESCDVYECGEGGISLSGGDRKTLTPAKHNAENNHVHHYSRRARTYRSGVSVSGVGNRIAHNLVHHAPVSVLDATTGKTLWTGPKYLGPGITNPPDLFVANDLVWIGETRLPVNVMETKQQRRGRDPKTGKVVQEISVAKLTSPGRHYRCYRSKATERFLLLPKRGVEFLDLAGDDHMRHDWLRAPCIYGFLPANG